MVITMLQAEVAAEHSSQLAEAFSQAGGALPPPIRESFLAHEAGTAMWRIMTVWESREALDSYRQSVDVPAGVLMFRSVGAEPTLSIHDVAEHASHP
jgi:hypothetical protein